MQIETVRGLVLRETVYGETDKLIDLLTESGIRTVGVRGARKPGSKYAAVTQAFTYGEYCLRVTGERRWLDSAVMQSAFLGLRTRLDALALAAYFSELIRKTATDQPQPQFLRLFLLCLHHLDRDDLPLPQIKAIFELRLMTELGMMPNLVCCGSCMRYLPPVPVLRIAEADLLCGDCTEPGESDALFVTQSTLRAARHIVFSEPERLFRFRLKGRSLHQLSQYAERYVRFRLGSTCRALKFYHELTENEAFASEPLQESEHGPTGE